MDNRIPLSKLEVFRCVVDLGGVTRAAAHLHVTQPVVTSHIRSLEQRMGTRLFERRGRRLALTEAGHVAYAWACDVGRRTEEMQDELDLLRTGSSGSVRIWAGPSVGSYQLPDVIADFATRRPSATISLEVGHPQHVSEAVEAGNCDFGVLVTDVMPRSPALRTDIVGREEMILVARSSTLHADSGVLSREDVARVPFITSPSGTIMRDLEDRELAGAGVSERRVAFELGSPQATIAALRRDLGVALLFRSSAAEAIAQGRLRQVALDGLAISVPIVVLSRVRTRLTLLQHALIEEITAAFADSGPMVPAGSEAGAVAPQETRWRRSAGS